MPKVLSRSECHKVVTYKNELGMTNSAIAEELGVQRQTVAKVLKRNLETGDPEVVIKGRKKKTKTAPTLATEEEIQRLTDATIASPFKTPRVLQRELKLECSISTIKRRLRDVHRFGRRAATKYFLTEASKERRLLWAREMIRKIDFDWRDVIFADEVKIETSAHGQTWVRRPNGTRYDEEFIAAVNRNARTSIMVWGAIGFNGFLELRLIEGTLNRWNYVSDILEPVVLPEKLEADRRGEAFIFAQDNAPPHRALFTQKWFADNEIELLAWPAQSPDLNPIENCWNILKDKIGPLNHIKCGDRKALWKIVERTWNRMSHHTEFLDKLYDGMPKRLAMIIDRKGAQLKY